MRDIMMDLETLSLDNNAVVTSIALVEFDLDTGVIGKKLEVSLDVLPQALNGGKIDEDTLKWWNEQSNEAKNALITAKRVKLLTGLEKVTDFITSCHDKLNDVRLWGNGISADNVWLRNLYRRHSVDFPLMYWCDKDVRTVVDLLPYKEVEIPFEGTKHNAIDDCIHQIKMVCVTLDKVRGK